MVKRAGDIVLSALGLIVLSPVLAITALLIAIKLGRPVLFKQSRPGRNGKVFVLLKFRSMLEANPADGIVSDEQRLTGFGKSLRASSLDELPALLNVFRGDMSLVGPRPLLVQYLERYTDVQVRRHEIRPGVTGLAQVNGRNTLPWEEKLELDVTYVDSRSFRLDLLIILRTIRSVFIRDGISHDGHATMSEFMGVDRRESPE